MTYSTFNEVDAITTSPSRNQQLKKRKKRCRVRECECGVASGSAGRGEAQPRPTTTARPGFAEGSVSLRVCLVSLGLDCVASGVRVLCGHEGGGGAAGGALGRRRGEEEGRGARGFRVR